MAIRNYGINDPLLLGMTSSQQVTRINAYKAVGFTAARIEANWQYCDGGSLGTYSWSQLDTCITNLGNAAMGIDLIVNGCPSYAASGGVAGNPPASATTWANYWAYQVANRYYVYAGVGEFEIWNEPNTEMFWATGANASNYTALVKAAYPAIKSAFSSAYVITGGLSPAVTSGGDIAPLTFLSSMYADGIKSYCDAISYHPYCYGDGTDDTPSSDGTGGSWNLMYGGTTNILSIMASYSDSAKQICVTEFGSPTNVYNATTAPDATVHSTWNAAGQSGQSTALSQAITYAQANTTWMGDFYLYEWKDEGTDADNDQDWFGLITHGGTNKTAYTTVKNLLT